jgi:hypothetical protein
MLRRIVLYIVVLAVSFSSLMAAQQKGVAVSAPDFPVILQQNVVAGKTPVGTKVQAKLMIATLFNGTVIPRNAVFSGEVAESTAKTATEPSRLSVLIDSAQWKNGSAAIKLYFAGWYYPTTTENGQDLQYGPPQPANRTWNGQGQYPDPNSRVYQPFPSGDSDKGSAVPDTPTSATSKNRVLMKDVEAQRAGDGSVAVISKHANIKLEKYTTYVFSTGDLLPQQK